MLKKTENENKDFYERVYALVAEIPCGKVTTYGSLAAALGMRSSARMVGWALNAAANRMDLPCHRVVNRTGELTGKIHFASPTLMRDLLEAENISFVGDAVNLNEHLWVPPIAE